jgi:RNA recognition motif-containing protein
VSSLRQPQGYCFIEFYDEKDAEYAKRKLDGERLNGRSIAVVWAKVRTCGRNFPQDLASIVTRVDVPVSRAVALMCLVSLCLGDGTCSNSASAPRR